MDIRKLIKNYQEFKNLHFQHYEELFEELAKKGQSPKTLFIGCSDSRIVPDLFTGAKPGDLFVVRNVGNFVPPFKPDDDFHGTAAAIEYAVSALEVRDIVVCGHSHCGACASLYKDIPGTAEFIHIKKWLEIAKPAKEAALSSVGDKDKEQLLRATEKASVLVQLDNLLTYPTVKKRVEEATLLLHGWYYKIETSELEYYDEQKGDFVPIGI